MLFRRRESAPDPGAAGKDIKQLVRAHLADADEATCALISAIAGLLACVAYADRRYGAEEQAQVRAIVSRIAGLEPKGVEAICGALREHGQAIAVANVQQFTRELRERAERGLRLEVLDALCDLAAADGELSLAETDLLRRTTSALGLSQDDYFASQSRHRERLSVLK